MAVNHSAKDVSMPGCQNPVFALTRSAFWLLALLVLVALVFLVTRSHADAGTGGSHIACVEGYTATVFARGLASPDGLAFGPDGQLYVAEERAGRVSRIDAKGGVTIVLRGLHDPEGLAFDNSGNLYVVEDVAAGRVVKMAADGRVTTLVTDSDAPEGVVWSPGGNLYFTESNAQFALNPFSFRTRITTVGPGGDVTSVLTSTLLWSYAGITIGPSGFLYVTNEASGVGTDDSIFVVDPITGERVLFARDLVSPEGLSFSVDGAFPLYVAEESVGRDGGRLSKVEANGSHMPLCTGFKDIEDVVVDKAGRLFVSEDGSGSIILVQKTPMQPVDLPLLLKHSISAARGRGRR
jgi:sugar lactone lactonase YvrE